MKNVKSLSRLSSLFLMACCGLGIWLAAANQSTTASSKDSAEAAQPEVGAPAPNALQYCPVSLFTMYNGLYYYACMPIGGDCTKLVCQPTTRLHQTGCPDCPDPIVTVNHPLPLPQPVEADSLAPQPDPMFTKVLR